jgi:hypothetical protein
MGKDTISQEENSSTPLGCENGVKAPGYNVVATGKCDGSTSSTRLVSAVEPPMDVKVTIKEEKTTDDMIEISIDLPTNPKVKSVTFLFFKAYILNRVGRIVDPRTSHKL